MILQKIFMSVEILGMKIPDMCLIPEILFFLIGVAAIMNSVTEGKL